MKKYRVFLMLAVVAAALQACSLKEELPQAVDGFGLSFSTGNGFDVKTDPGFTEKAGEDPWNENELKSVEYFLYRDGKTGEDAVLHGYLTNVQPNTQYPVLMTDLIVNNVLCPNGAKYFEVYAIANYNSRIVPAAAPGDDEDLTGTSVPELEALTQSLETVTLSANGEDVESNQSKFLMASDGPLRVGPVRKRATTIAEANVELKRVAAKLEMVVRIVPQVTFHNKTVIGEVTIDRDEIWEPRVSEATIYLVNGALEGQVSGAPGSSPTLFEHSPIYFDLTKGETHSYSSYELRTNQDGDPVDEYGNVIDENNDVDYIYDEVTGSGTFYPAKTPFYSYPQQWSFGSETEPYLKLTIPWDRVEYVDTEGGRVRQVKQQKQDYYRVYCPGSTGDGTTCDAEFLRNHWYKVILNVGILGSETDGGEIIIKGTYFIADWQEREQSSGGSGAPPENDSDKEAEIKGARYLFVNKEEYELYNIDDLSIPYNTSDPCEIVNFQATRYSFSGSSKETEQITNMATWGMNLSLVTNESGAHISFHHALDNDLDGNTYDVSEYTITFRLQQISNPEYYKDITIRQSPAIKIDMESNPNNNNHDGRTYVNNGTRLSFVGNTNGTSTGNNTNFNLVIIETTVLPPDSEFLLGDPRSLEIDNIYYNRNNQNNQNYDASYDQWPNTTDEQRVSTNNLWSVSATAVEGGTRYLRYYYPVDRSEAANNIIAPKFRVASSHGATNALTYANAFRRCASYQEAGYPAGRWRLPTVAEVTYAMKLNADGKIERLFGSGTQANNGKTSAYWCNCGYILVHDGNDAASKLPPEPYPGVTDRDDTYVRCVYDEWYWGSGKIGDLATFTWGDAPR